MKKRALLSNILYVVILVTLVGFLLIQFGIFGLGDTARTIVSTVMLALAVVAVGLVEIVFPVLDNKDLLKEKKYVILVTVKSALFLASLVILFLYQPFGVIKSTGFAIAAFVILYFVQFFINLDPKPVAVEEGETEADEEAVEDEEIAEDVADEEVTEEVAEEEISEQ